MLVELVGTLEALEGAALEIGAIGAFAAAAVRRWFPRRPERSDAQLRQHYLVERALADRLRAAPADARAELYSEVYDELFRRVPNHPQLLARRSGAFADERQRSVERQWLFLERFVRSDHAFMEVGAGDCALSVRAAQAVARVYAVDVSAEVTHGARRPANLEVRLTQGSDIPMDGEAVDVAFSDQLMEHLHPDDAADQLREIHRALAAGGVYVCVTPNRLSGPHDISGYFDEVARGLHLREYSARELRALFLESGFRAVSFYAGARGRYVRIPYALLAAVELALEALPGRLRRRIAAFAPMRALLGLRVAGTK